MKLYTLEYDCNLPTTQQVNVATNTDAKIGIKVKKNGEYLSLDGSTLSVEVGNEIVFDPTTINGTSAELTASSTTTNVTLSTDAAGSEYFGQNVAAKNIKVQISYDGTTWEDAKPLSDSIIGYWYDLTVDSRRPKALIGMANPTTFNVIFGPDTGTHPTELAWTEKTRIQMNANQYAYWDIKSYPCYMRICANFQKPNYQEMLSADAAPTNGYVTFPITTPDTASYIQDTVVVNKEHAFDDTVVQSGRFPAQPDPTKLNPGIFQLKASDIGAVGAVVTANQIGKTTIKQWRSANPLPEDISDWDDRTWIMYDQWMGWVEGIVMVEGHFEGTTVVGKEIWCRPKRDNPDELVFAERVPGSSPAQWITYDTYTLTKDTIFVRTLNYSSNYYYGQAIPFVLGGPTKAEFKLNVNTFKSQQGDKEYIKELPDIPTKTTEFAGTYSDNTPFSFDIFYK